MGRDTPVIFSLPAQAPDGDARGLCTLQIALLLSRTQNDVLGALHRGPGGPARLRWISRP